MNSPRDIFKLAARAFSTCDWTQAETLCRRVLLADPHHADALHMLGLVLCETGRVEDAVASLREALIHAPANPFQWLNLGIIYRDAGKFGDAVECYRQAISLKQDFLNAHFQLAVAYRSLGRFDSAIAALQQATSLRPDFAEAHFNLGYLFHEEGRLRQAVAEYQTALQINPDWAAAHMNIALVWLELNEAAKALEHYRKVLRLEPEHRSAEHASGHALMVLGRVEEARAAFARAAVVNDRDSHYGGPMSTLARETLAQVIPPDHASIEVYKARVRVAVQTFAVEPGQLDLSDLHTRGAIPSMMLAHYGGDVRPIKEQYAQAIAPHIPRLPLSPRTGKPKLGVIVTKSHEGVFARCWGGIAERLSRELFDVRLACSRGGANFLQTILHMPQHEYLHLPPAIDDAARLLREQDFDWLHYWEIGTDAMNYYLPFFRPAPGQSNSWGWPVTSGNPHVNTYLSCEQLEPTGGATHYTEQLVLLKQLPTYYVRPPTPRGSLDRSRFGWANDQRLYLCTQRLSKYHPDFDPLLADVLRSDPHGVLLIIADAQPSITNLLLGRFRRTMPDVLPRVRVMPRMQREEYLALVAVADVLLDTLHYGAGANTAYDAVAVGTPSVTLPGEFHRTLWSAAVNRRLGVPQLIASTPQEYVAKAVQVATNADLRHDLRKQILEAGGELFEDISVVKEHDAYFSEAIAATRAG